ncbi:DNA (cytosine-5)-methyltransferase 1 [Chytriomyces hyalinus]|nr:DNA (cytosine-5)-methyltransferase 1 [Chytriomyces hyalinus]
MPDSDPIIISSDEETGSMSPVFGKPRNTAPVTQHQTDIPKVKARITLPHPMNSEDATTLSNAVGLKHVQNHPQRQTQSATTRLNVNAIGCARERKSSEPVAVAGSKYSYASQSSTRHAALPDYGTGHAPFNVKRAFSREKQDANFQDCIDLTHSSDEDVVLPSSRPNSWPNNWQNSRPSNQPISRPINRPNNRPNNRYMDRNYTSNASSGQFRSQKKRGYRNDFYPDKTPRITFSDDSSVADSCSEISESEDRRLVRRNELCNRPVPKHLPATHVTASFMHDRSIPSRFENQIARRESSASTQVRENSATVAAQFIPLSSSRNVASAKTAESQSATSPTASIVPIRSANVNRPTVDNEPSSDSDSISTRESLDIALSLEPQNKSMALNLKIQSPKLLNASHIHVDLKLPSSSIKDVKSHNENAKKLPVIQKQQLLQMEPPKLPMDNESEARVYVDLSGIPGILDGSDVEESSPEGSSPEGSSSEESGPGESRIGDWFVDILGSPEESTDDDDEEEEGLGEKRALGPRASKFFRMYSDYYALDPEMNCGEAKYNFSYKGPPHKQDYSDDAIIGPEDLAPGDFVQIFMEGEVERWKSNLWFARITAVSAEGTLLRAAGNLLDANMLFQSRKCECATYGYMAFKHIARKVSIVYGDQLVGQAEYYVPFFYDNDDFLLTNVPAEFGLSHSTPQDLCYCPNSGDPNDWLYYQAENVARLAIDRNALKMQAAKAQECERIKNRHFIKGAFFSVMQSGSEIDAVIEIMDFTPHEDTPQLIYRMFGRCRKSSFPNELIWVEDMREMKAWMEISNISEAQCFVEFWDGKSESMAVRYKGAGRRFFFRNLADDYSDDEMAIIYPPKGLDKKHLKVFDAFCGVGNFSQGFLDSNIGRAGCAIDSWDSAVEGYNAIHKDKVAESRDINTLLKTMAISARNSRKYAGKHSFDIIMASPPCQDFTVLNRYRKVKGRALSICEVANLVECVPGAGTLVVENVAEWARDQRWEERENNGLGDEWSTPYLHLLAFLVSVGYQVREKVLNSANYGSPQQRNRHILIAARKDKVLPPLPTPSHHVESTSRHLTYFHKTDEKIEDKQPVTHAPCKHATVYNTIGDLPKAVPSGCVPKEALHFYPSLLDPDDIVQKSDDSRRYGSRLKKDGLFFTIAKDPIKGRPRYHYSENRDLTPCERGLAQGFSREDLRKLSKLHEIEGKKGSKIVTKKGKDMLLKQIGNAVPREMAFAIGCSVSQAL